MTINIITGPFYPVPPAPCGAVERLWHNLAEQFARRGHQVTVLCRHWPGQATNETVAGVRFIRRTRMSHTCSVYFDLLQDAWYSLRMLALLPRAHVTVTNAFWLPAFLRLRPRSAGAVVVNVNRWPKGQIMLYRRADRLAAASGAIRDEIVRQCPQVEAITKVLPNPIDTSVFRPPEHPRAARSGAGTILYTGRVHPEKGIHVLVTAFAALHREFPALRLKIIGATSIAGGGGGNEYIGFLKKLIRELPVCLVDPIYDRALLARELQEADYYCYPSLAAQGEALPVAPLEAMATGLPPVVSALAVFRDYIEQEQTGLIFDHLAADPALSLATLLRQQITDVARRQEMGKRAAAVAAAFSNEAVAARYIADFQQLISARE